MITMSTHIKLRQLGKEGPQISPMGFGCMGLSIFYGTPEDDEKRFRVLDKALELGVTHWDSSDFCSYTPIGSSNIAIPAFQQSFFEHVQHLTHCRWRQRRAPREMIQKTGKRSEIFLATKFAACRGENSITFRSDPEYIRL